MCKKGLPAVWTKEKIEEAFAGFVEKNRRLPVAREMKPQYGLPTRRTFERYMDTTAQSIFFVFIIKYHLSLLKKERPQGCSRGWMIYPEQAARHFPTARFFSDFVTVNAYIVSTGPLSSCVSRN